MGNCQAAEAAAVIIQHPPGKNMVDRLYSSVTARHVMSSNPGHFVALIVAPPPGTATSASGVTVKHLKLLRPDDMLVLGQVYRLVCVQDVLKEFAAKKCVKLAKLLERGGIVIDKNKFHIRSSLDTNQNPENRSLAKDGQRRGSSSGSSNSSRRGSSSGSSNSSSSRGMGKNQSSGRHWKPALQSITELGS